MRDFAPSHHALREQNPSYLRVISILSSVSSLFRPFAMKSQTALPLSPAALEGMAVPRSLWPQPRTGGEMEELQATGPFLSNLRGSVGGRRRGPNS